MLFRSDVLVVGGGATGRVLARLLDHLGVAMVGAAPRASDDVSVWGHELLAIAGAAGGITATIACSHACTCSEDASSHDLDRELRAVTARYAVSCDGAALAGDALAEAIAVDADRDARNLAWKLASVVRDGAPESLLATYAEERRLSTYRGSSLSEQHGRSRIRAGDRAPDVELRAGVTLSRLLEQARFVALFARPAPALAAELAHHGVDVAMVEGDDFARLYPSRLGSSDLWLVRPDGHVGFVGRTDRAVDRACLAAYLSRVGLDHRADLSATRSDHE